jgi:hypothetical protein
MPTMPCAAIHCFTATGSVSPFVDSTFAKAPLYETVSFIRGMTTLGRSVRSSPGVPSCPSTRGYPTHVRYQLVIYYCIGSHPQQIVLKSRIILGWTHDMQPCCTDMLCVSCMADCSMYQCVSLQHAVAFACTLAHASTFILGASASSSERCVILSCEPSTCTLHDDAPQPLHDDATGLWKGSSWKEVSASNSHCLPVTDIAQTRGQ